MAEWAFHAIPFQGKGIRPMQATNVWEADKDHFDGRTIPSFTNQSTPPQLWLYDNPTRYDLGQFSVAEMQIDPDGQNGGMPPPRAVATATTPLQANRVSGCDSKLDLFQGVMQARYNVSAASPTSQVSGFEVQAWTAAHPAGDILSHRMQVQAQAQAQALAQAYWGTTTTSLLVPRLAFAYPAGSDHPRDWSPGAGKEHSTAVVANHTTGGFATILLHRTIDNYTSYRVRCNATWGRDAGGAGAGNADGQSACSSWRWVQDTAVDHTFLLAPSPPGCSPERGYGVEYACAFAPVDRLTGRVDYLTYPPQLRDIDVVQERKAFMASVMAAVEQDGAGSNSAAHGGVRGKGATNNGNRGVIGGVPTAREVEGAAAAAWKSFWMGGAAVDLQPQLTAWDYDRDEMQSEGETIPGNTERNHQHEHEHEHEHRGSHLTAPRSNAVAAELERRVVLSYYASRALETGAFPPCESGLVRNSAWHGKSHLEMRWFHQGHLPAWGRAHLIYDRSDLWYHAIMRNASSYARYQGYNGSSIEPADPLPQTATRWPKQVALIGPTGDENDPLNGVSWAGEPIPPWVDRSTSIVEFTAPTHTGPRLIWQQPHVFWYAEQERIACGGNRTCEQQVCDEWKEPLLQTASFLVQLLVERDGVLHLDPPLIGGEEQYNNYSLTFDPTFELAYTRWALALTQSWMQTRWGLGPSAAIAGALQSLAPLPWSPLGRSAADVQRALDEWMTAAAPTAARGVAEQLLHSSHPYTSTIPVYRFNAACNCTFQASAGPLDSCPPSSSHPMFVGAYGIVEGQVGPLGAAGAVLDMDVMNATVAATAALWDWNCTRANVWGWDAAWLANAMARLGWDPVATAEVVMLPARHNGFAEYNGYNTGGHGALAAYLPGNGGLLHSIALMASGSGGLPWGGVSEGFPGYVGRAEGDGDGDGDSEMAASWVGAGAAR